MKNLTQKELSTFRFAIRNKIGQHSQQWRIWTQHNDCYIGSRWLSHSYKASFHESGQCQVGLSSEIRESLNDDLKWQGESRLYDKWKVDVDIPPGTIVKLLELIIPYSQLDKFEIKSSKGIDWINCDENKAVSIAFFKANLTTEQKVKTKDFDNNELCRLPLSNGYCILVLSRLIDEKNEYINLISNSVSDIFSKNHIGKRYTNGEIDQRSPDIRIMLWYKNKDGRYWLEASLKKITLNKNPQKAFKLTAN